MIHTNELMLGNFVKFEGLPNKVTLIGSNHVWLNGETVSHHYTGIYGIPITAELLEKCGMTKIALSAYKDSRVAVYVDLINEEYRISKEGNAIKVHFLHELQNAYFMLTKKHLEVKL